MNRNVYLCQSSTLLIFHHFSVLKFTHTLTHTHTREGGGRKEGEFFKNNFMHLFTLKPDTASLPAKSLHFRLSPYLLHLLIEAYC